MRLQDDYLTNYTNLLFQVHLLFRSYWVATGTNLLDSPGKLDEIMETQNPAMSLERDIRTKMLELEELRSSILSRRPGVRRILDRILEQTRAKADSMSGLSVS